MKNGIEILLINATRHDQDLFSFALNDLHLSYTCRFAKNVRDAIKKSGTIIPDYVFIDIHEKNANKAISFRQIKKLGNLKKTHVILYADHPTTKAEAKALQLGVCMCINKTDTISDLIHTLKEIFIHDNITEVLSN